FLFGLFASGGQRGFLKKSPLETQKLSRRTKRQRITAQSTRFPILSQRFLKIDKKVAEGNLLNFFSSKKFLIPPEAAKAKGDGLLRPLSLRAL
ncbi:hypothetical protein D1841_16825, partial [Neglecta sp. X4]|nr:hypothetical protein [Neglectibacter sp. 59]NBJ74813.1 hypothetical protein [Neglectibacter sp. X4]NCE82644.1 hypothetical protein [Neglectibacter sp. X58]